MDTSDLLHMQELLGLYYPSQAPPKLLSREPHHSEAFSPSLGMPLFPPSCCGLTFSNSRDALKHWHALHFPTMNSEFVPAPCSSFSGLSNNRIPIIQRVSYFLKSIQNIPIHPKYFRPSPHSQKPLLFKNPFSAVQALAYDFLQIVVGLPKDFLDFVSLVSRSNKVSTHLEYWPLWASYIYPILMNYPPVKRKAGMILSWRKARLLDLESKKLLHQLNLEPPRSTAKPRPGFICPFHQCGKTYHSLTTFRIHLRNMHLLSHHFKPENPTFPLKCPMPSCKSIAKSQDDMRNHILSYHHCPYFTSSNHN